MNLRQLTQIDPYLTPQTRSVYLKQIRNTINNGQKSFFQQKQLSQSLDISRSQSAQQMFNKTRSRGYENQLHVDALKPLYYNYKVIDRKTPFVKMHFNGGAYVDSYPTKKPVIPSTGVRAQQQMLKSSIKK